MGNHRLHSKKFLTANGKQTDVRFSANAIGYKSAHATVCALKHRTTVCCPFTVQHIGPMFDFFSCDNCLHSPKVLFFLFSLNIPFLFVPIYRSTVCAQTDSKRTSEIFVTRLCTNGQQTGVKVFVNRLCTNVRLTICAQMFQCTNSAQVHRDIRRPIHRTANGQQSDSKRTSEIFVNRLTSVIFCWVTTSD